jgi:hypothetical protein
LPHCGSGSSRRQSPWVSVAEANKLYKVLVRMLGTGQVESSAGRAVKGGDGAGEFDHSPVLVKYGRMAGNLTQTYGLTNLDTLSVNDSGRYRPRAEYTIC